MSFYWDREDRLAALIRTMDDFAGALKTGTVGLTDRQRWALLQSAVIIASELAQELDEPWSDATDDQVPEPPVTYGPG